MKNWILKYTVFAIAVLFVLPAGVYFGGQHTARPIYDLKKQGEASPLSTTYIDPSTLEQNTSPTASPPVKIPTNVKPIVYTIAHNYVTSKGNKPNPGTIVTNIQVPDMHYETIIMNYFGTSVGRDFDTNAVIAIDNVTVYWGTCVEIGHSNITKNLTQYESLFNGSTRVMFKPPDFAVQGVYISNLTISLYPGKAPVGIANKIEPVLLLHGFSNVPSVKNVKTTVNVTVPGNTRAAVMQIYYSVHGVDEFWYSNQPPYRALEIWSGTYPIVNWLPSHQIHTGGIDLFAWRPLTAPFTLNQKPFNINLTAALGILENEHNMTFRMMDTSPLGSHWLFDVSLMLYTSNNVTSAKPIGYNFKMHSPKIVTDFTGLGVSAGASDATTTNTSAFMYESVSGSYSYSSLIRTVGGNIVVSKRTSELSVMDQYNITPVWTNLTGYEWTQSMMRTTYSANGNILTQTDLKTTYLPIEMQSGFAVAISSTTNGTFPMYGNFTQYLENMSVSFDITHIYTNISQQGTVRTETQLINSVYTTNDEFSGGIVLLSLSGAQLTSVTNIQGITLKSYTFIISKSHKGGIQPVSGYQHILEAISNNPPAPLYFGTIVLDEVYTF